MEARRRDAACAAVCGVGTLVLGSAGALFMGSVRDWYPALAKPSWTPPGWLFGPVWTALYVMMGVALWLVARRWSADPRARIATAAWGVQMALNLIWTPVFFGLRSPVGGLVVIALLLAAIVAAIALGARVSRAAAVLLAPYLAWVTFATVLNAAIAAMN